MKSLSPVSRSRKSAPHSIDMMAQDMFEGNEMTSEQVEIQMLRGKVRELETHVSVTEDLQNQVVQLTELLLAANKSNAALS